MNKDHAYHQIALACLKTLRQNQTSSEKDTIKQLYQAIDQAFEQQHALMMVEMEQMQAKIDQIEQLDPQQHTLEEAQAFLRANGTAH
ncbi:MAG: hypothetical protein IBX52_06760 [Bacterioplanes sp.]|nr:hypothetical protein [Bacterioplanes sp.]